MASVEASIVFPHEMKRRGILERGTPFKSK